MYRNFILLIAMCLTSLGMYAQNLSTGTITGSPLCACASVSIPFSTTGTINTGNVYRAQLSDASGSFASPVIIGSLTSDALTGTINATIPCSAVSGTGYRIRVISTDVAETGTDNGTDIAINAGVNIGITISASPGNTVCAGTTVTYSAALTNGGPTPAYYWQRNGIWMTGSSTFVDNNPDNNDDINCILTSSIQCPANGSASIYSNHVHMTVNPNLTPSVSIVSDALNNGACVGATVTFTATPVNGGTTPAYQWKKNGSNVGSNSATYADNTLSNGDVITCVLTSNETCLATPTATSNGVTMRIGSPVTPSVSINAVQGTTICNGVAVNFMPVAVNGGTDPTYVWKLNGNTVSTVAGYTNPGTLITGDVISVVMTSKAPCPVPATANTSVSMTVLQPTVPSVSIAANPGNAICSGTSVTFTATPSSNAGTAPKYQWKRNGVNVGTNSATYTSSALANFDIVTCVITSDAQCPASSTSNAIAMNVTPTLTPSAVITSNIGPLVCNGAVVNFSAQPYAGGSAPSFQWKVDGVNVGSNSPAYFNNGTLSVGNHTVSVEITSNYSCLASGTGTGSLAVTVKPVVTPTVTISSPDAVNGNICGNASVTFAATPVNGGTSPQYQWKKNGVNITTGASYNAGTSLLAGDVITCVLTSNETCVTSATATSNAVTISHYPVTNTAVSVSSPYGAIACQGLPVTFTATATNAGPAPQYQWKKDGTDVGTNSPVYTSAIAGGEQIMCVMTSSIVCAMPSPANSNTLNMTVSTIGSGEVDVYVANDSVACEGEPFVFTSYYTNGGTNPTFQWFKNGGPIPGAKQATFSSNTLQDNDAIACEMTSNANCVFPVASTPITVEVIPTEVPQLKIYGTKDLTGYKFYSDFTGGGPTPVYQWRKNGVDIPGATGDKYNTPTLQATDKITLYAESSLECAMPKFLVSNAIDPSGVTGIKNTVAAADMQLFPNPNSGTFTISGKLAGNANSARVEVINTIGQVVYSDDVKLNGSEFNKLIELGASAAGVYTIRLSAEGQVSVMRFVIK